MGLVVVVRSLSVDGLFFLVTCTGRVCSCVVGHVCRVHGQVTCLCSTRAETCKLVSALRHQDFLGLREINTVSGCADVGGISQLDDCPLVSAQSPCRAKRSPSVIST